MMQDILTVSNLSIRYHTGGEDVCAVNGVSFSIGRSQCMGLVGETGAGKTTTALGILRLLPEPQGRITGGEIRFEDQNLLELSPAQMRKIRGNQISMIFQDPMTALNPIMPVGEQIAEVIRLHEKLSRAEAAVRSQQMLETVGISGQRYGEYPHQFSGGMKQRVVIAMALACGPALLIADEPTTALDVTIQAQVLHLMRSLQSTSGTSMILITHDLGVVAEMCDHVAIMYCGQVVEYGTLRQIYKDTRHPYTMGLFRSLPDLHTKVDRLTPIPGMIPDPSRLPPGCRFADRCFRACDRCRQSPPETVDVGDGHLVQCLFAKEEPR